ncbi:mitochondrial fission regulator 2 isoform X2 [Cynoglossus semilaevis]|uniref:mitochondrial fission regulator 2 isoform X1 n=1 Tax=Cynoglossus semilaevis TaxID=244447 RepID=UPI0007DCB548|nr:mitochondrial fission regulator 2 isoform X1 [Cynoglossus semilaevis]XP_024912662.1 mitochondrial fission regulator 2 isoform X2 [Cynoglossus semilaevis]
MSLVDDILNVLHMVLEYFGVSPEMLVPVWDSQLCGQYRSIVRMIGTNLPLTPTPRVHFQIPLLNYKPHGSVDVTVDVPAIPSFADVLWVFNDEGETFAKTRNHLPPKTQCAINRDAAKFPVAARTQMQRGGRHTKQMTDPAALKKITALEDELQKLRAQIAMIVTVAPGPSLTQCQNTPGTPLMSPLTRPVLCSTPRTDAAPPPPPPPPPPLPPPPCPRSSTESSSVLELIRKRKNVDRNGVKGQLKTQYLEKGLENKHIPSMLDVLKDLTQVKLRSVERSPGGTPVSRRHSKGQAALFCDPAALIADALKRKFAHHHHNNSSDKENSLELSPFGSPETPKVPQLSRRSQGRLHLMAR